MTLVSEQKLVIVAGTGLREASDSEDARTPPSCLTQSQEAQPRPTLTLLPREQCLSNVRLPSPSSFLKDAAPLNSSFTIQLLRHTFPFCRTFLDPPPLATT
ncbi:hypothetical protein E2C01_046847 [Portunus trituberculatus]|uniref:Uncharacterized protein n=1 Tax=Portunus trituberculatus TaxID=210409 RepID=A0A5B7G668_PORTR|nr:hypothetical protein [Portunus trituberculatus]